MPQGPPGKVLQGVQSSVLHEVQRYFQVPIRRCTVPPIENRFINCKKALGQTQSRTRKLYLLHADSIVINQKSQITRLAEVGVVVIDLELFIS